MQWRRTEEEARDGRKRCHKRKKETGETGGKGERKRKRKRRRKWRDSTRPRVSLTPVTKQKEKKIRHRVASLTPIAGAALLPPAPPPRALPPPQAKAEGPPLAPLAAAAGRLERRAERAPAEAAAPAALAPGATARALALDAWLTRGAQAMATADATDDEAEDAAAGARSGAPALLFCDSGALLLTVTASLAPPVARAALACLGAMLFIFSNWRAWILSQLGFAAFLNAVLIALFLGVAAFFAFAPARAMELVSAAFACAGSGAATALVPREEHGVAAATCGGADSLKSVLEEDLRFLCGDSCLSTDCESSGP